MTGWKYQENEERKKNHARLTEILYKPARHSKLFNTKEIGDEEPYYSTKISIFPFLGAGLAALHKASTIQRRLCKVELFLNG